MKMKETHSANLLAQLSDQTSVVFERVGTVFAQSIMGALNDVNIGSIVMVRYSAELGATFKVRFECRSAHSHAG